MKGNIFDSGADALVNTVNTVGVMGKGLALQFKELFPENYKIYRNSCLENRLHVGELLVTEDSNEYVGKKTIINFPTKTHWRLPSEYNYIEQGLVSLRDVIITRKLTSIAIPPLGSHNGGLDWFRVREMIISCLSDLDCEIFIYEPSSEIQARMKSERVKLTPARAMLLIMFDDLVSNGEFASLFAAEKLIYFLQRFGAYDIFKINFKPYFYGPYSGGKVAHLLHALNGSYIKGMTGMDNRPFDYIWTLDSDDNEPIKYIASLTDADRIRKICNQTQNFLQGFYSNYTLELLATTDYILTATPSLKNWLRKDSGFVLDELATHLHNWSTRKEKIFQMSHIEMALDHMRKFEMLF